MPSIHATEDSRFAAQLNRLEHFNQFISGIATAIVAGNHDFESVWSIANRVYEATLFHQGEIHDKLRFGSVGKHCASAHRKAGVLFAET